MNYRQANLDYLEDYGDQPIPVFSDEQIEELFNARCADLQIPVKIHQLNKFTQQIDEQCSNRRINLTKMFLGTHTAKLIARLLMREEINITHLIMPYNNL